MLGKDLNTSFVVNVNNGSYYDVFLDPGINESDVNQTTLLSFVKPPTESITMYQDYRLPGTFNATVRINNSVSRLDFDFEIRVGINFSSVTYNVTSPVIVGTKVNVSVEVELVDITCVFDYDNGEYTVIFDQMLLELIHGQTEYSEARNYTTSVLCMNAYNMAIRRETIEVIEPISGLHFVGEGPVKHVAANEEFVLEFAVDNGSAISWVGSFGTEHPGQLTVDEKHGTWNLNALELTTDKFADVNLTLTAENVFSSQNRTITISVDTEVQDCGFQSLASHVPLGEEYTVMFGCQLGSRLTFWLDTDSDQFNKTVLTATSLMHNTTWTTVGCRPITLTVNNSVSSVTISQDLCVQKPLPPKSDVEIMFRNISDIGVVTFTFKMNVGKHLATIM